MSFVESAAGGHDSGWPTTPDGILKSDTTSAICTSNADTLELDTFDFSAMESSVTDIGITVRVDGDWHDPGTTDITNPRFGVRLSWDGGTNWTGIKRTALLQKDNKVSFTLGGGDQDWGHTWTRPQIVDSDNFHVEIRSDSTAALNSPEWRAEYLLVSVHYTITEQIDETETETIGFEDKVVTSRMHVAVKERLTLSDAGVSGVTRVSPNTQYITLAGSAITELQSEDPVSNFTDAAAVRHRADGAAVMIISKDVTAQFIVSDPLVATSQTNDPAIGDVCQPGLIQIGNITQAGNFGQAQRLGRARFTLANRSYYNRITQQHETMASHAHAKSFIGGFVFIYAFVEADGTWYKYVTFTGNISDMRLMRDEVTVFAIESSVGTESVPRLTVNDNTFTYGTDEGQVPDTSERVVPIGIGRFNIFGVRSSWPSDHPFDDSGFGYQHFDAAGLANTMPSMLGVLHPIMPIVLASKLYRTKDGTTPNYSPLYQNVYLYGERIGVPSLELSNGWALDEVYALTYNLGSIPDVEQLNWYINVFSWENGRASPWIRDMSARTGFTPILVEDYPRLFNSAGNMDGPRQNSDWTAGEANNAIGVYVNARRDNELLGKPSYTPPWKTIAIPMAGQTVLWTTTPDATPNWQYGTHSGVDDPENALDWSDLSTATVINEQEYVSYQLATKLPSLGRQYGLRICVLVNRASTATLKCVARFGPYNAHALYDYLPEPPSAHGRVGDWRYEDFRSVYDNASANGYIKIPESGTIAAQNIAFGSFWIIPPWTHGFKYLVDGGTEWWPDGFTTVFRTNRQAHGDFPMPWQSQEWQFTGYDRNAPGSDNTAVSPIDVRLYVNEGASPRTVTLYAVWGEAVYEPNDASYRPETLIPPQYEEYNPTDLDIRLGNYDEEAIRRRQVVYMRRVERGIQPAPERSGGATSLYVTGDGTYFNYGHVAESPMEIAEVLLSVYGGQAYATRATGSVFGSFSLADADHSRIATALNTNASKTRLAMVVDRRKTLYDVLSDIGAQSFSMIQEQLNDSGQRVFRMFVDDDDPATNQPERLYRGDGGFFHENDIVGGNFEARLSDVRDLAFDIKVKYGYHRGEGRYVGEFHINPDGCNLLTQASNYQSASVASKTRYGLDNPQNFEMPDLWDPEEADVVTKMIFNSKYRRRVIVEFDTFVNAIDLRVGHVITFDDDVKSHAWYPGEVGSSEWSNAAHSAFHQFTVIATSIEKARNSQWVCKVIAVETFTPAV